MKNLPAAGSYREYTSEPLAEEELRRILELLGVAVGVWDQLSGTESFVHKRVQVEKG